MKQVAAFTLVVGLFVYLQFIDIYDYPSEEFKAGNEIISKSEFYNMRNANAYLLDGVPVTGQTFANNTDYVVCLNGFVHLSCDLWAWVFYCWVLLIITLLSIIWFKLSKSKFYSQVGLFAGATFGIMLTWEVLRLFNIVPNLEMKLLSKSFANAMFFMGIFLMFINKIKNTVYENNLIYHANEIK